MPIELQIIRAQEFIRLGAHGHFDLEASKDVLKQLATACWKRGINQALLDIRALHPGPKPVFSARDLVALVHTFREVGFTQKHRLAVLYGSDPHYRARLFSFIATVRGWKVQAFNDFEKAIFWLSAAEPEASAAAESEVTAGPRRVPVRKHKPLPSGSKPAAPPAIEIKSITGPRHEAAPVRAGKIKPSHYVSASKRS